MPNLIKLHIHKNRSYIPILVNVDKINYIRPDELSNETIISIDGGRIIVDEPLNKIEKMIHKLNK